MTSLNDSTDKIREMVSIEIFDGQNDYLEHYGVSGMKWGVRSAETLRKYGMLTGAKARAAARAAAAKLRKSKAQAGVQAKRVGTAAKAKASKAAGSASKAAKAKVSKSVDDARKAYAIKKTEAAAKKAQAKAEKKMLDERRKELGMSRSKFNKLREEALRSDDPIKVARGSQTLTDTELKTKLGRLDNVQRIYSLDTTRKQARAKMWDARFEALNKSPLNSLLIKPASEVTSDLIVNQLYGAGLKPLVNQRVTWDKNNAENAFASTHPGARQSNESKAQAKAVRESNEAAKARADARKDAVKSKLSELSSKMSESGNEKARSTNERIAAAQKEFDRYESVVNEGRKRTAAQTNRGTAAPTPTPSKQYDSSKMGKYTPKPSSPVDNLRPTNEMRGERSSTSNSQRTRKPETYANNAASSAPGVFEAKVVSSSSRASSKAAKATRSSSVYNDPVSSTAKEQRRGQMALARMR